MFKITSYILQINAKTYYFLITFSLSFNILYSQIDNNDTKTIGITKNQEKDSIVISNNLEDILDYKAELITNDFPNKMTYLVENAFVNYTGIEINADYINIDWNNNEVKAYSKIDSLGQVLERAAFTQDGKTYQYESFKYNFKTKEGVVYNARTIEDEALINAEITKRVNDSVFYLRRAFVTTDEYYKENKDSLPDYHINLNKAKLINDRALIAGSSQLYIEQVPTPLVLPFLYVPLEGKRSAGIILPSFGEREALGFFLQGFGLYVPIGEYFDFQLTTDVYTKGSIALHGTTRYKKNYRYNGSFRFDYDNRIEGIKGLDTYSKSTLYNINWTHTQDRKANPNLTFNASVGFSSSTYFRNSVNNTSINNGNVLNNNSNSSISLNKYFDELPLTLSLTANYSQNFNTEQSNLTLPQFTATVKRQYPFKRKNGSNKGLIRKLQYDYRFNALNQMSGNTDDVFSSDSFKDAKTGFKHQIGVSTGTTFLNYFQLNIAGDYNEIWQLKSIEKSLDATTNTVITSDINKFASYRTFGANMGVNTTLYKTVNFGKNAAIQAIRHTVTPNISYSIRPDFSSDSYGYYDSYVNNLGEDVSYSRFEGGVFGSPSSGETSSIGFGLSNNLEIKVKSKTDSVGVRKIKIFDYLNIGSSYNLAADSLRVAPISITGATSLFDSKLRVNFGATINPYEIQFATPESTSGSLVDNFGDFTLSSYNVSLNFGLNNAFFGKQKEYDKLYKKKGRIRYDKYYFDNENYAQFAIPWDLSFGLQYTHTKGLLRDATNTATLSVNGKIAPAPYWTLSGSTNYDFVNEELAYTRFNITRDLRSFNITFSWVPFGQYRTWDFFIGIKASIFKDAIKYEENDFSRF